VPSAHAKIIRARRDSAAADAADSAHFAGNLARPLWDSPSEDALFGGCFHPRTTRLALERVFSTKVASDTTINVGQTGPLTLSLSLSRWSALVHPIPCCEAAIDRRTFGITLGLWLKTRSKLEQLAIFLALLGLQVIMFWSEIRRIERLWE
jgi:hypothetical protein